MGSAVCCSLRCVLHCRAPAEGGEELLDLVELGTPLCEGGGGDQGVASGPLLGLDRPAHDGADQTLAGCVSGVSGWIRMVVTFMSGSPGRGRAPR